MTNESSEINHEGPTLDRLRLSRRSLASLSSSLVIQFSCVVFFLLFMGGADAKSPASEASAGFDQRTNGFVDQSHYDSDRAVFQQPETVATGLGPVYNGKSCFECHQNPVSGGDSSVSVVRAGHHDPSSGAFVSAPGGVVMHVHATDPAIDVRIPANENIRSHRKANSLLGDGYVEAISDLTLLAIAKSQEKVSNGRIAGEAVLVPVIEAGYKLRVGRFGWKSQHASIVSFSADAYINEEGITNRYFPVENTALGKSVAEYDAVADPEDPLHRDGSHLDRFVTFIRATKAPPRYKILARTPDARAGERVFEQIGCGICHIASIRTAPAGTMINGGKYQVPEPLGGKLIHPYSDFLLHSLGTGDGIPLQIGGQDTANKMRTAPLWGLRMRTELMHDGASSTPEQAILRHGGEAQLVGDEFRKLSPHQKQELLTFLKSL
jgi:CxxC motif-containing protein (DUF1111 family)